MEDVLQEELRNNAVSSKHVTVKQEVIDEGYGDGEVFNGEKSITDASDINDCKDSIHFLGNVHKTIAKSELEIETSAEIVKHEIESSINEDDKKTENERPENIEDTVDRETPVIVAVEKDDVKTEPVVKQADETGLISLNDGKAKGEEVFENNVDFPFNNSIAHSHIIRESAEKEQCLFEKKGYSCKICKKTFVKKSSLSSHEMTHTGETPFKCQFCDKGFNVRSNLNVHLRIHTGQRPHVCEICQKTFRQAGQLKTHERIHKGEKPYICNMCTRSFRSSSALITHQRTHTGERPFPCDLCSRSFSTSTSLKTHRITHSGTMLYDCPVCGRQFNRKNNLNVHIKRHNKNRKFSCPKCSNGFVMRAHLLGHLKRAHKTDVSADELKHLKPVDIAEQCNLGPELKHEHELEMKTEIICDDATVSHDENHSLEIKGEFDRKKIC